MHLLLRSALVASALALAGCGGSDAPSEKFAYQATLLAGEVRVSSYDPEDGERGCIDGAALGAQLNPLPPGVFGLATADHLMLAENGRCDGRNRIRLIDLGNQTIRTLASSEPASEGEPLTTFLRPTSMASGPSGELYIADSDVFTGQLPTGAREVPGRGSGIWKLGPDGNLSLLAGVVLPSVGMRANGGVDGQGSAASFGYLGTLCFGADGLLYVTDNGRIRTVTNDGNVRTLTQAGVEQHEVLACGPDGSVLIYRRFSDPEDNDYYDPIGEKSIAKATIARDVMEGASARIRVLAYFGSGHPEVVIQRNSLHPALVLLSLTDGHITTLAQWPDTAAHADLAATPPVIGGSLYSGLALSNTDFALLTGEGIIRFDRKHE